MQYYCQLHSLPYTQVCLQPDCTRKGPLCDMCTDTHVTHVIKNLDVYINEQIKYLNAEYQTNILQKLESLKAFFHTKISQLLIDVSQIDEKRKKELVKQLKSEKMSIQQYQSKLIELVQRDQLKDREYLESFYEQITDIEKQIKQSFSQLPIKLVQPSQTPQTPSQSSSIINYKSEGKEISPELTNRSNRSKEPIFQQKQASISPIRKQLLQRDLMPVGSFNNSKLKNYFTEQDSQQSARSKQDTQNSFKITKPFDLDKSSDKAQNQESYQSKQKSQNSSFEMQRPVEPFKVNNMQTQSIDILPKSPGSKTFDRSPKTNPSSQQQSVFKYFQQEQPNQSGYFANQMPLTQNDNKGFLKDNIFYFSNASQKDEKQQQNAEYIPATSEILNQYSENQINEDNNQKNQYSIFKDNQQPYEQHFSISNQLLFEPTDQYVIQQQPSIKQSTSSQSNLQAQLVRDNKSQLDLSYISSKSIGPPQVKLTPNLLNPLSIEYDQTLKGHDKSVKDLALMDADKIITCSKDTTIKIWDKRSRQLKTTLKEHKDQVLCVAFSKKRIIASGSVDKTVRIWKPNPVWKQVYVCEGHADRIRCLEFVGNYIASGSDDTYVKFWDFDGSLQHSLKTNARVSALAAERHNLVIASGKNIILYDTQTNNKIFEVSGHKNIILCLALSSNNSQNNGILISGSKDNCIKIWQYPKLQELRNLEEDYPVHSISFDPDSQYLFAGLMGFEQEGKISVWKLDTQPQKVQEISMNPYGCNKVISDGKSLYSAHENKRIEFYTIN
ncbi:unnamed protein product (macronuclear) [Paramecium tetraurelia]|uniref:Uncharacterized protein n=1 Tax=Paramecium tetraurelia TaxID=5888 RepID=A0DYR4_PARTE|nr:uncharacterized protein GSPATT00003149001 [Paramecium tetraurelia]CAK88181.1 unnamed protein product [Paramecium tetraurelia]|eukprot:XP_001455578.1 hypothetical protein (macronuclear) [Paramecium tetraurelia strain d4-2]